MKRILLYVMLVLAFFGLAACESGSEVGEFPEFKEGDLVELSGTEMVELFQNLEYSTETQESMRLQISGMFNISTESDGWGYSSEQTVEAEFDLVVYTFLSPLVAEARLHAEGDIDFTSVNVETYETMDGEETDTYTSSAVGNGGIYFYNQYLYLNSNIEATSDDETESAIFKQKISEQVTQTMWDDTYSEELVDEYDDMLPTEVIDMIENGDFDELMEAIPNLKVYKDGQTYSVVFEINKQGILDNLEDVIRAAADMAAEYGETPTEAEIEEAIDEARDVINAEIENLSVKFVISIKENKITKLAMDVEFLSKDGEIEIDLLYVIDFGVELPSFPSDLDEYEEVDYPGEGVLDN